MFHDPQYHARTTITKPREPWQEILLQTVDLLERVGWGQGNSGTPPCIIWAISRVDLPGKGQAVCRLTDYLGMNIIDWNEIPGRTKIEVLAALRGCAA